MQSTEFNIKEYRARMTGYLGDENGPARLFWDAFSFAERAHAGQFRRSGDAYICHPCQVALIMAEELDIKDPEILAAALLHDTVEDVSGVTNSVIGELFGANVETIVDGCTKITHFARDKQTFYKLVHRKIFSGAASKLEIMLVKMADRLHNLRTLNAMPRHKRQKIAEETLDIYAPMAKVMGLFGMKRELYDLALIYKFPRQGHKVLSHIHQFEAGEEVGNIVKQLRNEMENFWFNCKITSRVKGLWAYYDSAHKLLGREIDHPYDIIIEPDDIPSCYQALGVANQKFFPIPRTIRDFIANPKPTGYQALHSRANIKGRNCLFKIRTAEMARRNQRGIVKDWFSQGKVPSGFEAEIREMFDILGADEGVSYREVIAASRKKEIYTYTPKGDRICLPTQSTVLDFAFKVHTEVGRHCAGAVIGRQRLQPDHVLKDGDQVTIIRQTEPVKFDPRMLELCQSPRGRSCLAKGFRDRRQALAREIGLSILRQELKRYGVPFDVLEVEAVADIFEYFDLRDREDLFQQVGEGKIRLKELVYEIIQGLCAGKSILQSPTGAFNRIYLTTLDPVCIKFSACCRPVTDKVLFGLLSERGLSVHRKECPRFRGLKLQREDVVELHWRHKKTPVIKPQVLLVMAAARQRILMMLAVTPEEMKVTEVLSLSRLHTKTPPWEISFEVNTLHGLNKILHHFSKSGLSYEFILEQ